MNRKFVFFSLAALMPMVLSAETWADRLDFERAGAGYDSEMKEYPMNEPIRINGGYRLISGAEISDANGMLNAIRPGMDSIPEFSGELEKTFPLSFVEKGRTPSLSMEVKGKGNLTVFYEERKETFPLTDKYRKIELAKLLKKNSEKEIKLKFQADGKAEIRKIMYVSLPGLKACGAWVPPGAQHRGERFVIPPDIRQIMCDDHFKIEFEFEVTDFSSDNVIFEQTNRGRWWPELHFAFDRKSVWLSRHDHKTKKSVSTSIPFQVKTGVRYRATLERRGTTAIASFNGEVLPPLEGLDAGPIGAAYIGGSGLCNSLNGILYRVSGGVFDNAPILPKHYIRHLARSREMFPFRFEVEKGDRLVWQVGTLKFEGTVKNGSVIIPARFPLPVGKYQQTLCLFDHGKEIAKLDLPAEITPAVRPKEELQVVPWMQKVLEWRFTYADDTRNIGEIMQHGLRLGPIHWRYVGHPRKDHPEDRTANGKLMHFTHSEYMRKQLDAKIRRDVKNLAFYPALGGVDINNETCRQHLDDCPKAIQEAKEQFNLTLDPKAKMLSGGRVMPSVKPEKGIMPDDDPFYAWHVKMKGAEGENEVYHNSRMMKAILAERPDIETIFAPILRTSPVPTYGDELTIAQHWRYSFGLEGVFVWEGVKSKIRGKKTKFGSFPAFCTDLYGNGRKEALPTGDIFRASCWASLMQPTCILSFFQAKEVHDLHKQPGLAGAAEKMLNEEIPPFAALFPVWKDRPRKVAFYRSFANQLYSAENFLSDQEYLNILNISGAPYDIILDADFFRDPDLAMRYNLIVAPNLKFLPACAHKQLSAFAATKGKTLLTSSFCLFFKGGKRLKPSQESAQLEKLVAELTKKYGNNPQDPRFAEALESQLKMNSSATLAKEVEEADMEAFSHFTRSYLNVLELDQTRFLGLVNDLRTFGPVFGKYKKVPEIGVPQTNYIDFKPVLGKYAYDLMKSKQLPVEKLPNGKLRMKVETAGADGKIIALLDQPVGKLSGKVTKKNGMICVDAALEGNASVPGWIQIDQEADFSGPVVFREGKLHYEYPDDGMPVRITLKELASGKKIELSRKF